MFSGTNQQSQNFHKLLRNYTTFKVKTKKRNHPNKQLYARMFLAFIFFYFPTKIKGSRVEKFLKYENVQLCLVFSSHPFRFEQTPPRIWNVTGLLDFLA